jgi:hypothetical protein
MRKNDRQKFKRQAKSKRYMRMRLTNVIGDPEKQMRLFAEADKHAILGEHQLAAGIWRHPHTGLWQVWFSTAGSDINWISAHRSREGAKQDVEEFKAAALRGDFSDAGKAAALFTRLLQGSEAEPETMSAVEILNITKQISENAFDILKEHRP